MCVSFWLDLNHRRPTFAQKDETPFRYGKAWTGVSTVPAWTGLHCDAHSGVAGPGVAQSGREARRTLCSAR